MQAGAGLGVVRQTLACRQSAGQQLHCGPVLAYALQHVGLHMHAHLSSCHWVQTSSLQGLTGADRLLSPSAGWEREGHGLQLQQTALTAKPMPLASAQMHIEAAPMAGKRGAAHLHAHGSSVALASRQTCSTLLERLGGLHHLASLQNSMGVRAQA